MLTSSLGFGSGYNIFSVFLPCFRHCQSCQRRQTVLILDRTNIDKVNAELVTLTYGTMVAQLCSDFNNKYSEVNKQLDKMGYNIGMRLIEDFFAKSGAQRCSNFRETAETISKVSRTIILPGL